MLHAQADMALQLFTHAENFLSSSEIWNVLGQAFLRPGHQFVVLLIQTLQECPDFDLELQPASIDGVDVRPEHLDTLLAYTPCLHAMFEKARVNGNKQIVRLGLNQGLATDEDNWMHRPAVHFAAAHGHTVIVDMLLK